MPNPAAEWRWLWMGLTAALVVGCSAPTREDRAPRRPLEVSHVPDAIPRAEPRSERGNPPFYEVGGRRYHVMTTGHGYRERGVASWYGEKFHGRATSSGEPYDMYAMTAAHKTLPLPTYVRVTNLANGHSVVVRVNDRGPFVDNRIIDMSYAAAVKLGMIGNGTAMVDVQAVGPGMTAVRVSPVETPVSVAPASTSPPAMYVQAGAFGQRGNAAALAVRLRDQGLEQVVVREDLVDGRALFRVRVGPVSGVDHFDWIVQQMASLGIPDAHLALETP